MIWKIEELTIQGFKSFKREQKLDFSEFLDSAFIFIEGKNLIEAELEGNGAGKSSIFDSLTYLLFGKTASARGSDLENWSSKKCSVGAVISNEVDRYTITRTRNPNALTVAINGASAQVVSQEQLEEILGYDLASFGYSVVASQFSRKFFDLTPSEKMQLFDSVMEEQVMIWTKKSEEAKEMVNELDSKLHDCYKQTAFLNGKIEALEQLNYNALIANWEEGRVVKLSQLNDDCEECYEIINQCELKIKNANEKLSEDRQNLSNLMSKHKQSMDDYERELLLLEDNKIAVKSFNIELNHCRKQKDGINGLQGISTCPVCRSQVTAEHLEKELSEIGKMEQSILSNIVEAKKVLDKKNGVVESKRKRLEEQSISMDCSKQLIRELELQIDRLETSKTEAANNVNKYVKQMSELENEQNPFIEQQENTQRQLAHLRRKLARLVGNSKLIEQQKAVAQYWVKGFKEIGLMVIGKAITNLEFYINDYLQKLGLLEWNVKLQIDRETQNKTISKGFTVNIISPVNNKLVPFECWSGGEGQRLRLAGTLGFMDFVGSWKGRDWSIEVYDEPTQWLSQSGITDLLGILKERAKSKKKQIFIIDHRDFRMLGDFDNVITVTKSLNGSEVTVN